MPSFLSWPERSLGPEENNKSLGHGATVVKIVYISQSLNNLHLLTTVHTQSLQSRPTLCDCRPHQAPLSVGFTTQEYCSELPCPSLGNLPDPGIQPSLPESPTLQVDSLPFDPPRRPSVTTNGFQYLQINYGFITPKALIQCKNVSSCLGSRPLLLKTKTRCFQ